MTDDLTRRIMENDGASDLDKTSNTLPKRSPNNFGSAVRSRWGIGRRLLVQILLFSSLITLILSLTQLYLDYRSEISQIEQRFSEIQSSNIQSLTTSLWNMDRELLESQLRGMVNLPDIDQVTVTETVSGVSSNLVLTLGEKDDSSHISREFYLTYRDSNSVIQIGVLTVEATLSGVYQRLMDKVIVIMVSQGIKTFIVSLFILFIIHWLVTRHLVNISNTLSRIDTHDKIVPLKLNREPQAGPDELDHMVQGFNSMEQQLKQVFDELQQSNDHLEQRVDERTRALQDEILKRDTARRSLRESQQRFRDIAETASDWFWEMDDELSFSFISQRFSEITGIAQNRILGRTRRQLIEEGLLAYDEANSKALIQRLDQHQPFQNLEGRLIDRHNKVYHIQIGGKPMFDEQGVFQGYRGAGRDITARKLAEEAIQRSHDELEIRIESRTAELHKLSQAVEQSPISVIITNTEGRIEYVNQALYKTTGYQADEVIGKTPALFKSDKTHESIYREMWATLMSGKDWSGELLNTKKDGSDIWVQAHISPVKNPQGEVTHFLAIEENVTLRKTQEQHILHQAKYDALTDLPNRLLAVDRLDQAIKMATRDKHKVGVMYVDLDDFKKVNDTLGHNIGDLLLVEASRRLEQIVRDEDTVARQGGDEFLIILNGIQQAEDIGPIAQKIVSALSVPFTIEDIDFVLTPSIGLSLFPDDGQETTTLLRNADAAMYRAKNEGGNGYHYFTQEMNEEAQRRLAIERHLRHALQKNELRVVYQPIIDVASGNITSAEALLRWNSKQLGSIGPDQFIPVAEQTGIITTIGQWVSETACTQMYEWNQKFGLDVRLAVNVSPRQFRNNAFINNICKSLASGLDPCLLEIEVTEGLLISNQPETIALLKQLKSMGVGLSMDDFGTGYSSLSYLQNLPFDKIKIDKSFIQDIADETGALALVTAAITMARSLDLQVIAEGVETEEQFRILKGLNCDFAQGYLFSRPLDSVAFEEYLNS